MPKINLFQSICQSTCIAFAFSPIFFFSKTHFVHFYFYNQFSRVVRVVSGLRSSSFLSLFSLHLIRRICFMSILIELLGEKLAQVASSSFHLFHTAKSNCSHSHRSLTLKYLFQMRFYFWYRALTIFIYLYV